MTPLVSRVAYGLHQKVIEADFRPGGQAYHALIERRRREAEAAEVDM